MSMVLIVDCSSSSSLTFSTVAAELSLEFQIWNSNLEWNWMYVHVCTRQINDKVTVHTVAIWTFPFHQNSVKNSDDFQDLTLAQYNLKKSYFWLINMEKKCCVMKGEYNQHFLWNVYWAQCTLSQAVSGWSQLSSSSQFSD